MEYSLRIYNAILYTLAVVFTTIIYLVDTQVVENISIGALYVLVVLYSWLFPGKTISLYIAAKCTVLIILAYFYKRIPEDSSEFYILNAIISVIVVWICALLVTIAKRSFDKLEEAKSNLELKVKKRTEELHDFNLKLVTKNKELEQFAYVASHDMQEPLQTILNFSEQLEQVCEKTDDKSNNNYVKFISQSAERIQLSIKGLLDYTLIGKKEQFKVIESSDAVNEVLREMQDSISESNARITVGALPQVKVYPNEFRLLIKNLISNAIKFQTPDNAPQIDISCEEKVNSWRFTVKDNGLGIAEEFKEKVFEMFQRLHHRKKYTGAGVGLALCAKIVDLHEGLIWVKENPKGGSIFYFTIPKAT